MNKFPYTVLAMLVMSLSLTCSGFVYGLPNAYFDGNNIAAADHFNVYSHRVKAGDTLLVHAGVCKVERYVYAASASGPAPWPPGPSFGEPLCCGGTFYGTYFLTAKGAGDGEANFDGNGAATLFNVMGSEYYCFESLTFRNVETVFQAGHKEIAGVIGLTVKHSKFEDIGEGIHTDFAGVSGVVAYNNIFIAAVRFTFGARANNHFRKNLIFAEFPNEPALTMTTSTAATGQDTHSQMLDYETFENLEPSDTEAVWLVYDPDALDFKLGSGSATVDVGVVLPVTQTGLAPDLGAYEVGVAVPYYGVHD